MSCKNPSDYIQMRTYSKELITSLCSLRFLPNNRVYLETSIKKKNSIISHTFCYGPKVEVSAWRSSNEGQGKHNICLFLAFKFMSKQSTNTALFLSKRNEATVTKNLNREIICRLIYWTIDIGNIHTHIYEYSSIPNK